ncbi:FAD-dependent oxidoreductase [Sulfobacillus thermosulfidooxidans]|uniref:FAD-dependent oxidoreductase n=1 Tax=Sulfobacillus thermosulfidooxidans TaxID=28034 RepID=UPI0006B5B95D|nr:FAD-dependent oxidoreductase [Sulfobacillus thermosulfidooxidans]
MKWHADILIIGGGIIGTALAYELTRSQLTVTLLEQHTVGSGTSYGAAGMLPPQVEAHEPGLLLKWGLEAFPRYQQWQWELKDIGGIHLDLDTRGIIQVAETTAGHVALQHQREWQERHGLTVRTMDGKQLHDAIPGLRPDIDWGIWTPGGHVNASQLSASLAQGAILQGAQILEGVTVTRIDEGRVESTQGQFTADTILVASGPWINSLLNLPISPVKGQRVLFRQAAQRATSMTVFGENVYLVPKSGGQILAGSTEEPTAGFDQTPTLSAILQVGQAARDLCPVLDRAQLIESWAGLRPCAPDGVPIIDHVPHFQKVWVVGAHCRNGILLAPVTAQYLVRHLTHGTPLPDEVRLSRFSAKIPTSHVSTHPTFAIEPTPLTTSPSEKPEADGMVTVSVHGDVPALLEKVFHRMTDFPALIVDSREIVSVVTILSSHGESQTTRWTASFLGYPMQWTVADHVDRVHYQIHGTLIESNIFDYYTYDAALTPSPQGTRIVLTVTFRLARLKGLALLPARQLVTRHLEMILIRINKGVTADS